MEFQLEVPDAAVRYILYQRTNYLHFTNTAAYKALHKLFPQSSYKLAVGLESRLRAAQTKERYAESMRSEYESLRAFLPSTCRTVLDIGCGVAGIDPFIARHYQNPVDFYLLDKTTTDREILYGFRARASFYNSLSVAQELLALNAIPEERIHPVTANSADSIPVDEKIDLAISLLAWGFHFPVSTYLDQVHSLLSDEGLLILDIQKDTDGIQELRIKFGTVDVILKRDVFSRVAARK